MERRFATLILAGGRGSRMGSATRHKVCFDVLGTPAILRALGVYTVSGSCLNTVVVGMMAEDVMRIVTSQFPATAFAFQARQLGTGDAARCGARVLEQAGFRGDVLVVAGDKVLGPTVVRALLKSHRDHDADLTFVTVERPEGSTSGTVLTLDDRPTAVLETWEIRRLQTLREITEALRENGAVLPPDRLRAILLHHFPESKSRGFLPEIWSAVDRGTPLTGSRLQAWFGPAERAGLVQVGSAACPADEIEERYRQVNLSVYVFRAEALYDALHHLQPVREGQETYLTDVVAILAAAGSGPRVRAFPLEDPHDVMAFNDPGELLAVEEHLRSPAGPGPCVSGRTGSPRTLAPSGEWAACLESPSPAFRKTLCSWYGDRVPWETYRRTLEQYRSMTTEDGRPVAILRSPGRINLMGRHVDHQGGSVNVMAINRELLVVASPRQDDLVQVRNADPARFPPNSFRITQLISELDWNDWLSAVEGPRTRRLLDLARGDWSTYVKAAVLRLQEHFRDRLLHGMDLFVAGDIPMGAGLSSSSALVVAAAEACARFNDLPLTPRDLVGLCGEGEWFVGTRGGTADHAAIRLSERGTLQRIGFFPFRIEGTAPFPEGHDLVVCNSGIYAGKSADARHRYNQKVTSYHIARTLFRHLRPGLADRIEHLRDITPQRLGVPFPDFCSLLGELPESVSREEVRQFLRHVSESEVERLERLFESHEEPAGGYRVRDVAVFGLTEIERAQRCLGCLETGAVDELGRLMTASHDGDRISVRGPDGVRVPATARVTLRDLQEIGQSPAPAERFSLYPGSYACSLPEIDEIVDTLLDMPGVRGAQMAGAGLGGCVMALVSTDTSTAAVEALRRRGLEADVLHPIAGAAVLPAPH